MAQTYISSNAKHIIARLHEIDGKWGLNNELKQLQTTISKINHVLPHTERFQKDRDEVLKAWLEKAGDAVYDADDMVDKYYCSEALRGGQQRPGRQRSSAASNKVRTSTTGFFPNKLVCGLKMTMRYKIKEIIKKLAASLDEVRGLDLNVGVEEDDHHYSRSVVSSSSGDEKEYSSLLEEEITWRDEERKQIFEFLLEGEDLSILNIYGEEGLGKSTLVQLIFNNEQVRGQFEFRKWVNASKIKVFKQDHVHKLREHHLLNEMKGSLGKRYLLVLDDADYVFDILTSDILKDLLSKGVKGSKIVLISKSALPVKCRPVGLHPLTKEDCWNIFKRVANFKYDDDEQQDDVQLLEKYYGRQIVESCPADHFVTTVVGRMCYFLKKEETEWFNLRNELNSRLEVLDVLSVCYHRLPSHLKPCFAFCSLFLKGDEIDVQTLIKFWMAQGFILDHQYSTSSDINAPSQCMEDVGYEYFKELLWRFFFKKVETDEYGNITKCKMDDRMCKLANQVAGEYCTALGMKQVHDIVLANDHEGDSDSLLDRAVISKRLRTVHLHNQPLEEIDQEMLSSKSIYDIIWTRLKFLRMLDLHNTGIKEVPNSIGKLKHLRYLDLSENPDIKALPVSVTRLVNLQTLKLSSCYELQELPKDIQRLVNLRHLEFDWCYSLTHMPHGIGQLTNLRTLSEFVLNKAEELSELKDLNNLRGELKIKGLSTTSGIESAKSANLKDKQHLRSLLLAWDYSDNNDSKDGVEKTLEGFQPHENLKELALVGYKGHKFSNWFSSLHYLVKFSLRRCKCKYLPPLSQIPSLKILILDEMTDLEFIYNNVNDDFLPSPDTFLPSLKELRLSELPKLRGWSGVVNGKDDNNSSFPENKLPSFPSLSKLIVEDCPKLISMPHYPQLEEWLVLDNTSWMPFQQTLRMQETIHEPSPSSSSSWSSSSTLFSPLSKLKTLCIVAMEELDESVADTINWQALRSLSFLRLDYLPKLAVLPGGLRSVISLQELHIWRCNIESLPDWISELVSLTRLSILVCPYLASFPEGINRLSSLNILEIVDCPILLQRCQRSIGADWHKIAHIPNLKFPQLQSFIASSDNRKKFSSQESELSQRTESYSKLLESTNYEHALRGD